MFQPEIKSRIDEDISILIKLDNYSNNIICECGYASDLTVKDCQNTEAIFLSHTHIDHFINFDFILRHQIGTGKRVIICGPNGITKQVQSKIKGYQWNLIEADAITYEIREIKENGEILISELKPPLWSINELESKQQATIYSTGKFDVHFVILDHKTDSIAYLFKEKDRIKINITKCEFKGGKWVNELKSAYEENNKTAEINIEGKIHPAKELFHLLEAKVGDSLGIIMDHAASQENHEKIISLFKDCNKVFIECFYKLEDKELADMNFHSYSTASARVMKKCNVKNAIPVHFSRKYGEDEIDVLLEEFNYAFS